jgi:polyisoprenoid-binding protein YceI
MKASRLGEHDDIDEILPIGLDERSTVMRAFKPVCLSALLLLLNACAQAPLRDELPSDRSSPPKKDLAGAQIYTLDPQASQIHILVYRGGTLARLGHNHVISSKSLHGRAWLHADFQRSGFEVTLPVATLIVDDPSTRALHGEQFATDVAQKDIDGTRRNLMRPEVLYGEQFPEIKLVASRVSGTVETPQVSAHVTIKGVTREIQIPLHLSVQQDRLIAIGEFDLLQSDFGIKPFSIALGALQVRDELHVTYRLVATRNASTDVAPRR